LKEEYLKICRKFTVRLAFYQSVISKLTNTH